MPVRRVVIDDAKVGAAHDFEVIGQAGMAHSIVVGGQVGSCGVAVDERCVGVADDLGIMMVLHQDHEGVINAGNFTAIAVLCNYAGGGEREGDERESSLLHCHWVDLFGVALVCSV